MDISINRKLSQETQARVQSGEIDSQKVDRYFKLLSRIENELLSHPIIVKNEYSLWFSTANLSTEDVRRFLTQFSVFSNLFIEAQLKKTINAPSLEAMHQSKEILMNELGVIFKSPTAKLTQADKDAEVDPSIVGTEGTVEGSSFKFAAAHFEWLLRMVEHVGLTFSDVGKRKHGTTSTLFFCDELARLYGSDDGDVGLGASFAVENWAARGFWKELVQGLTSFKKQHSPKMPLAFFTWHDRVEEQHAAHTWHELEEEFFTLQINEDKFIKAGQEMLNGVMAFWTGLNEERLHRNQNCILSAVII